MCGPNGVREDGSRKRVSREEKLCGQRVARVRVVGLIGGESALPHVGW